MKCLSRDSTGEKMRSDELPPVVIDGEHLTIEAVVDVARRFRRVELSPRALERARASRAVLEEKVLKAGLRCYGVTTGLGPLGRVFIGPEDARKLQENVVLSHSCAVGDALPRDVVRAMMLIRANTLAKGLSGVRPELLERLVEMLNRKVHPVVPSRGSVGASGDLALLAHVALVLLGRPEGRAEVNGEVLRADEALRRAGIRPLEPPLDRKEGLALVNGTSAMTAIAALAVHDAGRLVKVADICLAMTLEAIGGFPEAFDLDYLGQRAVFPLSDGQGACAENVLRLVEGSELLRDPRIRRAHDPYSVRCAPQVHGSVREGLAFARSIVEAELNSADDNPLFFGEEPFCRSGGNFHGQPVALASDVLSISMATLGNISERRVALLLTRELNEVLPSFLVHPSARAGLNSGLMIPQYVAASLASENKVLAHPASVDTIPTAANFEDFVSMGLTAALKARDIVENVTLILAIEFLCAFQAISLRGPERAGRGTKVAYELARSYGLEEVVSDRPLSGYIEKAAELVRTGRLLEAVEGAIGRLR